VNIIARFFDEGVALEEAMAAGGPWPRPTPFSSRRTWTTPRDHVNLYSSASLAAQFPDDAWTNGEPGNFTVSYSADNPAVDVNVVPAS
jgi:hypothetical protein